MSNRAGLYRRTVISPGPLQPVRVSVRLCILWLTWPLNLFMLLAASLLSVAFGIGLGLQATACWLIVSGSIFAHELGHVAAIWKRDDCSISVTTELFEIRIGAINSPPSRIAALAGPLAGLTYLWAVSATTSTTQAGLSVILAGVVHLHALSPAGSDGQVIWNGWGRARLH